MATKPVEKTDWAIDEDALITATDGQRWNYGWTTPNNDPSGIGEKPNLNQQNYWQNAVHKWIEYLREAAVPVGSIIPIASNLTGAFDAASGEVVDGFMFCDGSAIPSGQKLSGNTPVLNDSRFLMGSATAGGTGGSNTNDHTHTLAAHKHTLSHTHSLGTSAWAYTSVTQAATNSFTASSTFTTVPSWTASYQKRIAVNSSYITISDVSVASTQAPRLGGNTDGASTTYTGTNSDDTTGSSDTNNIPKYLAVKYFIKVGV